MTERYTTSVMERESLLLRSDLEEETLQVQERHDMAQRMLDHVGQLLQQADHAIQDLEQHNDDNNNNNMLGSTIVRASQHLADTVGSLAQQIDQQSAEERRALAQACWDDAAQQRHGLLLGMEREQQRRQRRLR